jgi:predicted metal-dependent phosphoesterase TrpH
MSDFRADLHCHTNASDGTDSVEELLKKASELGLKGISITDHDTIDAYALAFDLSKRFGVSLLPGVEISSTFKGESIHVLAYGFSILNPHMIDFLSQQQKKRTERNARIFEKLKKLGIEIEESQVLKLSPHLHSLGRPHIAQLLMERGIISSMREAFDKYLGEGKPAYDPGERFEVPAVIEAIHKAKGLAVIAHPHLIKHKRILKYLLDLPFDGIECHYAKMLSSEERPFVQIAEKKGWLATGGSDYHGAVKSHVTLGCSWVNETIFQKLYDQFLKNTL